MSTKHTPGPWIARRDPDGSKDDSCIGLCEEGTPIDYVAVCRTNDARLIAAAPELLAALRDVIGWVPGRVAWHTEEPTKAVDRARAAIAKAIGGAA